jgi:predicted metalloprotease with PDZ domain
VQVGQEPAPLAQQLGLRVSESPAGITLKNVLRDGLAEQAGMAAGDEWLAAEFEDGEAWRIQKLDDLLPLMGLRSVFTAWVSRDRRMLRLNLQWPSPSPAQQTVVRLTPAAEPASGTAPAPWPATAA